MQRRDFLALTALGGGAVFASGLAGCASRADGINQTDFYFVQLSDTHWGYQGPANPDAAITLRKAVATVNALETPPEFIVFTGDLTHTTDDPAERRRRLAEFKSIVADLKVKTVRFMPGEHDASLDRGAAYKEFFGETSYTFDHKGVHFIAIDNVSDPGAKIGDEQLAWLRADLAKLDKTSPHRRAHAPPAVRPGAQVGLGNARRCTGRRAADAVCQCHRLLRPHPPGAPPDDGAHRAPLGEVADLPAAGARLAAQPHAVALGRERAVQGPGLS
jgi:hypothetical protein